MYATVKGYGGVAWRTIDDEWEPQEYEEWFEDEDGSLIVEVIETTNPNEGKICCCMVGDDRLFYFDPEDVEEIKEDFCLECGQIGCGHLSAMEYFGGSYEDS